MIECSLGTEDIVGYSSSVIARYLVPPKSNSISLGSVQMMRFLQPTAIPLDLTAFCADLPCTAKAQQAITSIYGSEHAVTRRNSIRHEQVSAQFHPYSHSSRS